MHNAEGQREINRPPAVDDPDRPRTVHRRQHGPERYGSDVDHGGQPYQTPLPVQEVGGHGLAERLDRAGSLIDHPPYSTVPIADAPLRCGIAIRVLIEANLAEKISVVAILGDKRNLAGALLSVRAVAEYRRKIGPEAAQDPVQRYFRFEAPSQEALRMPFCSSPFALAQAANTTPSGQRPWPSLRTRIMGV